MEEDLKMLRDVWRWARFFLRMTWCALTAPKEQENSR